MGDDRPDRTPSAITRIGSLLEVAGRTVAGFGASPEDNSKAVARLEDKARIAKSWASTIANTPSADGLLGDICLWIDAVVGWAKDNLPDLNFVLAATDRERADSVRKLSQRFEGLGGQWESLFLRWEGADKAQILPGAAAPVDPEDKITARVALKDFEVSRPTLYRYRKSGRLKGYRPVGERATPSTSTAGRTLPKRSPPGRNPADRPCMT